MIRRVSELHGPDSSELVRALRDIDDVLQAKLTDVRAKEERQGLKVGARRSKISRVRHDHSYFR